MDDKNKYRIVSLLICVSIFCFHYWLAYPGITTFDTRESLMLSKSGWHPVVWSYVLQFIFSIFGKHVYYLLLLSLLPFYFGIYLVLTAFYNRYHSWFSLFAIFPAFIGNIFLINFHLHSSSLTANWMFLLYAECLYWILSDHHKPSLKFLLMTGITFIIAMLGRHNSFIQVIPVSMLICFMLMPKDISLFKKSISLFLSIVLPVTISISVFASGRAQPSTSTLLWHMAAACVPNDDTRYFQESWYLSGKTWEDVKKSVLFQIRCKLG